MRSLSLILSSVILALPLSLAAQGIFTSAYGAQGPVGPTQQCGTQALQLTATSSINCVYGPNSFSTASAFVSLPTFTLGVDLTAGALPADATPGTSHYAEANADLRGFFNIDSPTTPASVVFHFAVQSSFPTAANTTGGFSVYTLVGPTNGATTSLTGDFEELQWGSGPTSVFTGYVADATGMSLTVPFGQLSGSFFFRHLLASSATTTGSSAASVFVTSHIDDISIRDAQGAVIQNATYSFTQASNSITPEPSSLALLATGLVGIVPFARRKLLKS